MWRIRDTNVTIVVYMAIVMFHSNKETYRQYRLKTMTIDFLRNKIKNVDKMIKTARSSIFRTKLSKNRYSGMCINSVKNYRKLKIEIHTEQHTFLNIE